MCWDGLGWSPLPDQMRRCLGGSPGSQSQHHTGACRTWNRPGLAGRLALGGSPSAAEVPSRTGDGHRSLTMTVSLTVLPLPPFIDQQALPCCGLSWPVVAVSSNNRCCSLPGYVASYGVSWGQLEHSEAASCPLRALKRPFPAHRYATFISRPSRSLCDPCGSCVFRCQPARPPSALICLVLPCN